MIKLYKNQNGITNYWETWENEGVFTIHYGQIGEKGTSSQIRNAFFKPASKSIKSQIESKKAEGYLEIPTEDLKTLMIEYKIDGMGNKEDLDKRHKLQSKMDECLGWTGLGHCDGGSSGSGTMEVCCLVVDYGIAKSVIENDLKRSVYSDYIRIYEEKE